MDKKISQDKPETAPDVVRDYNYWQKRFYILSRRTNHKLWFICAGMIGVLLCFGFSMLILRALKDWDYHDIEYFSAINLAISALVSLILGVFSSLLTYSFSVSERDRAEYEMKKEEAAEIKENIQIDFFDNLIKLSNNYLDQYYNQTKVQAEKSFMVSLLISVFGALIICFGIVLLLFDKTSPAYITTAAGVLSEFIAAIFFYFYNSTIKSMSRYHNKLVLSQNISIALKVADTLPEPIQGEVRAELIKQLITEINKYIVMEEK